MDRLPPEEIASMKHKIASLRKKVLERNPSAQFAKPADEEEPSPAPESSSLQKEARKACLAMGMIDSPSGGMMSPSKK